jgi:hypothetical protein
MNGATHTMIGSVVSQRIQSQRIQSMDGTAQAMINMKEKCVGMEE